MGNDEVTIAIINFNTLGVPVLSKNLTERYITLGKSIEQQTDANILTFQEVHTYLHLHLLRKLLKHFPYVVYKKALYGPKGGLVTFSKLAVEQHDFNKFRKRGHFHNRTFYAKLVRNGTLVCKLKDYPLYILNTYFTTNPNKTWHVTKSFSNIQATQIHDLASIIGVLKENGNGIIVTGDFNFTKESEGYALFTSLTKAKDVFSTFSLPTYLFERRSLKFLWRIKFLDQLFVFNAKASGQVDFMFIIQNDNRLKTKEKNYVLDEKVTLLNGKESFLSDHVGLYAKMGYAA